MHSVASSRIPLPDLAVLQFQGADALTFLQGQLSNDVVRMPYDRACLAAWCSAKGRVLATLVVWRESTHAGEAVYALVKADVAEALVKRLSLFVLRAKVTIRAVSRAVAGEILTNPETDAVAWKVWRDHGEIRIQTPDAVPALRRCWCVGAEASADGTAAMVTSDVASSMPQLQVWHAADIAAGLPWIGASNQDTYIPQTLNLDLLGAISFTKGCYPGQEVVARSHYRGTIKRRMVRGSVAAHAAIGMDLFKAGEGGQPCGRVINLAEAGSDARQSLLLEVQLADLAHADFRLGAADGAKVTLHPLPYPV